MKKLVSTFGLLTLMLIVTSFTTPNETGGDKGQMPSKPILETGGGKGQMPSKPILEFSKNTFSVSDMETGGDKGQMPSKPILQ